MHCYFELMKSIDDDGVLEAKDFPVLKVNLESW
jgi:hypothetical protein